MCGTGAGTEAHRSQRCEKPTEKPSQIKKSLRKKPSVPTKIYFSGMCFKTNRRKSIDMIKPSEMMEKANCLPTE